MALRLTTDFSHASLFLFLWMTIFGFRPFALPNEFWRIKKGYSFVGLILWLPTPFLTTYMSYNFINSVVDSMNAVGFFHVQTVIFIINVLCFMNLLEYIIISLVYAPELSALIMKLDTIVLKKQSFHRFTIFTKVAFLVALFLHFCTSSLLIFINCRSIIMAGYSMTLYNYLTFLSVVYFTAVFIYPSLFLVIVSYYTSLRFGEIDYALQNCPKKVLEESLPDYYFAYLNLAKILENVDNVFGVMIFGNVTVCLVIISVFLLNIGDLGTMPVPVVISVSILIFGNFFGINFICIYVNDKSREIRSFIHEIPPTTQIIRNWLDSFHQKIMDNGWGLTFGKFFLLERTAFIGLSSAMLTIVAMYGQLSDSQQPKTNSTTADFQSILEQWQKHSI